MEDFGEVDTPFRLLESPHPSWFGKVEVRKGGGLQPPSLIDMGPPTWVEGGNCD